MNLFRPQPVIKCGADHYCEDIDDFSVDGWIGSNADTEDDL